jgi:hypothetical protein
MVDQARRLEVGLLFDQALLIRLTTTAAATPIAIRADFRAATFGFIGTFSWFHGSSAIVFI